MSDDDDFNPFDPHAYSMDPYYGTPTVRYTLIDPDTKTFSEGTLPRAELVRVGELLGLSDPPTQMVTVAMEDDRHHTVMAKHDMLMARDPKPDATPFWYQPKHTEPGTAYRGKALVFANSTKQGAGIVSCRLSLEQMGYFFYFEEPKVHPESLMFARLMKPAVKAVAKYAEALAKVPDRHRGELALTLDAHGAYATMELLAAHLPHCELAERDFLLQMVFAHLYNTLTDEGYLDASMETKEITEAADAYVI
jgi:hypothetical protein